MSIALVGGSGLVGRAVAFRLLARGEDVVIVDRVRPPFHDGLIRAAFVAVDLVAVDAPHRIRHAFDEHAVDAVVHLAARVNPPRDDVEREAMRRLHEDGTRTVCREAIRAAVRRVVLVSSAVVYGAWPDNAVPLATTAPLRPCALPYAVDKAMQEAVCRSLLDDDVLTIVRPAIVYAADAHNYLTEILRRARLPGLSTGVLPSLDGRRPPLQFVHVDDVADIVVATIGAPAGVYHAASSDWLPYEAVAREAGLHVVDVPARLLGMVAQALLPLMSPSLRAPRGLFPYLMHPFVIEMTSTMATLGIAPRWSSAQALQAMLEGRGRARPQ